MDRSGLFLFLSSFAFVGYMFLVYWLSDMPSIIMDVQRTIAGLLRRDVLEHCLEFIPLGALSANLVSQTVRIRARRTLLIIAAASTISILYGVFDEIHQSLVLNRIWEFGNSLFDVFGDAIGAIGGIMLFLAVFYVYRKKYFACPQRLF